MESGDSTRLLETEVSFWMLERIIHGMASLDKCDVGRIRTNHVTCFPCSSAIREAHLGEAKKKE